MIATVGRTERLNWRRFQRPTPMVAVYSVLALLLVFALALLIIRIGSIALNMTGLSPDVASFQAASAFTGAGFTTDEAEHTVQTPARRAVIKTLIRLGSLGFLTAIAPLVGSFTDEGSTLVTAASIVAGAGVIVLFARSEWLNRLITPVIERTLSRTTDLAIRDYTRLLGLQSEYGVCEIDVTEDNWLAKRPLAELNLPAEGVLVLAIERADGSYVGAPGPETEIQPGDTVVLYGQQHRLQELSKREADDTQARADAVKNHQEHVRGEGWDSPSFALERSDH